MIQHQTGTWTHVLAVVLGLTAALTVLLVAFAWPPSQLAPRDLPVAVTGPPGAAEQVSDALGQALGPDALDVEAVGSRAAAVAAVERREAYGAVVVSPAGPEMLVASAAGPAVAQSLTEVENRLAEVAGAPPQVTDVVPLPESDPGGAVFAAGALPLVIGGLAAGAAIAFRVAGRHRQAVAVVAVSVAAGMALTAVQQYWFEALTGSYWANAGVYALAVGAMAAAVVGLHRLWGQVGVGVAAATILLLGNPLSGITSAPELLPAGWSELGQLLPPGAAGTALRSTAFFDGAGATAPLLVLTAWLVVGLALLAWPARQAAGFSETRPARRTGPRSATAA